MSRSDSWLTDLQEAASALSLTDLAAPSPMTASSGLSLGGSTRASGEYAGGGAKRAHLFCFDQLTAESNKLCLGLIGEGKRFCTKLITVRDMKGNGTCGIKTHGSKFKPELNMFFTRASDSTAYCHPAFPMALLSSEDLSALTTMKKSITEWNSFFQSKEDLKKDNVQIKRGLDVKLVLKTPTPSKRSPASRMELPVPFKIFSESLEADTDELPWWNPSDPTVLPPSLLEFLRNTHTFLANYSSWWEAPLLRVAEKIDLVQDDLSLLQSVCERLRCDIGKPVLIQGTDFPDIWCALEFIGSILLEKYDLPRMNRQLEDVSATLAGVQLRFNDAVKMMEQVEELQSMVHQHQDRFDAIRPLLLQIKDLNGKYQVIADQLARSEKTYKAPVLGRPSSGSMWLRESESNSAIMPDSDDDIQAKLNAIVKQISHLEKRVVGEGVTFGNFVFQSLDDVRQWTLEQLPNCRFGLFVDVVSLLSFLSSGHALETETMTVLHNSSKNGFKTMRETRVAASMQNLLPTVFGKGAADGLDTSNTLPGISTPERWDKNGVSGLKHQIERELSNIDTQFSQAIASNLEDYPEARQLATECLYRSKKFATDICNYLSHERAFWVDKGYSEKHAHELACTSVRRIVEDIYIVRVVARDSRDLEDPHYSCALILWATFRAHKVMEEYTRRHVKEHPSISAVIARHLATHHAKPSKNDGPSLNDVKKLEQRIDALQKILDRHDSRLSILEAKNGIAPPNDGGRRRGRHRNKRDDETEDDV